MTRNQEIAQTIISQLGGRRFSAMTGAKNMVCGEGYLQFDIPTAPRNRATKVRITLTPADLYRIECFRFERKTMELKPVGEVEDMVFAEDLQERFVDATGLEAHL